MRKTIAFILFIVLVVGFYGCTDKKNEDKEMPLPELVQSTPESDRQVFEMTQSEAESSSVIAAGNNEEKRCFYGEHTGTAETYTGLEKLEKNNFESADFSSGKHFPKETISHSFGVAANGKAHDISINNQKFFDEKGYDAICLDNKSKEKVLYLTFDCGYENGYTSMILDVLKEKNVKAAFFCTLSEVKPHPEIIARMINEGHVVGNHSVTHPDFSSLSRKKMYEEVKGFDDYMREHFGYSSLFFRYPQGKYNEDSLYFLNSMGFKCVFWSLAYSDWDLGSQKGADYAVRTVTERLHPGAVILLHAVSPDNAEGLGDIIDTARDMGYEFVSPEKL